MSYCLRVKRRAARGLAAIPADIRRDLALRIAALAEDPFPTFAAELHGPFAGLRKLRVGAYRIVYSVDDAQHTVTIVRVGHRHNVYK